MLKKMKHVRKLCKDGMHGRATLTLLVVLLGTTKVVVLCGFPATLRLERAFPTSHGVELSQLRARDAARHPRILQESSSSSSLSSGGVVDFPVEGTYDPYRVGYFLCPQ
ncbi:hypothetical protein AgCh_004239 [Apium graveolens]